MKNVLLIALLFFVKCSFAQDQRIFLLTDRENYAPGDTIWIQAKLINAKDRSPAKTRDILYISLDATKKTKAVISQFENGNSNSQLVIPRSFKSGFYTLQAYTKYLEQFGPAAYFTKKIKINVLGIPSPSPIVAANPNPLELFPEGGKYLVGFSTKVGFKINLPKSEYKGRKGQIMDSQGETIASFYPDHNGIGHVSFMPKPYEKYVAVFKGTTKKLELALPQAAFSGLSLSVDNVITRQQITITVNNANNVPDSAFVQVYKNDSLIFNTGLYTENQQYKLSLNQETFDQEGLVHVLLLDAKKQAIADRWIYVSKENNYVIEKEIKTEKIGLTTSETLEIIIKDQDDKPVPNQALTIKIGTKEKDIDFNKTLRSYLNFSSQLNRMNAKIDTFFEQSATAAAFNIDNLMMVHTPINMTPKVVGQGHEQYFTLNAKVFSNGIPYPSTSIKLFIKDKYSISSYDLSANDSSMVSIGGNWFDSLTVFATDLNFKPLELGFEKNDFAPSKPKFSPKKTTAKPSNTTTTPEVPILKTDFRRKRYAGKADLIIKPKNAKDTIGNVLEWTAVKLKKTKFDTLHNFQSLEVLRASNTEVYLDGNYITNDVLSLINQRDIAQIDFLYSKTNLATFNKKDGCILHILSKSKRAREIALAGQSTQKILAFEPLASFKNRNRTLSGQQTIVWAPDQISDRNGKIMLKLSAHNKTLPYIITVQGLDKYGNVIETDMPLYGEK